MERQYKRAPFSLDSYSFIKSSIDLEDIEPVCSLALNFTPSGEFISEEGIFNLNLEFSAVSDGKVVVYVKMKASYKFAEAISYEDIPSFFYSNSIAILFPYIRAFVSTITLQSNITPILLPTLNISALEKDLRSNTEVR